MTGHSLVKISEDLKHYRSAFCRAGFGLFLSFQLIRKVSLINRGSVRSERTRDKNNAIKVEKDSQRCKGLCSKELKGVKFRILAE